MSSSSTTLDEAVQAILNLFVTNWGTTTPYQIENENFKPPSTGSWVRVWLRHGPSAQVTLGQVGNRKFERDGSVLVNVFTNVGAGRGAGDALAKQVRAIFEGKRITDTTIRFFQVPIQEAAPDGKWYQTNVIADFRYTEVK